jgi:hypothetical protein
MTGFYRPSEDEFKAIWNGAIFVLDANVLLNLYRYPTKASQDLLGALGKLSDRLWLPYQAALEYQRNRLGVIAEQKKRFADVRTLIDDTKTKLNSQISSLQLKKRHSSIDVEEFLSGFESLTKAFLETLRKLEEAQPNVFDDDQMRNSIDDLLSGKIGPITFDQIMLNELYKEGERRYEVEMPPGYMDAKKEKSGEPDSFQYASLVYKRKFGDLVLWKQIISYTKEKAVRCLVLLTDDEKEDWWWAVDSQGEKRIGPRPELVEEIKREGQVDYFYMYNSEQFLKYSKEYLQAEVSEESISQVREVRLIRTVPRSVEDLQRFAFQAEEAVFEWLVSQHPASRVEKNRMGFPDFILYNDEGQGTGFEVKVLRDPRHVLLRLKDTTYRAYYEINERGLQGVTIVIVMETIEGLDEAVRLSRRHRDLPANVKILFGLIETREDESEPPTFRPIAEFTRERDLFNDV